MSSNPIIAQSVATRTRRLARAAFQHGDLVEVELLAQGPRFFVTAAARAASSATDKSGTSRDPFAAAILDALIERQREMLGEPGEHLAYIRQNIALADAA